MRPTLKLTPWNGEDPFKVYTWRQLEGRTRRGACCMRRARARYWRIARGYLACGVVLGLALGMVLGAASKVCP